MSVTHIQFPDYPVPGKAVRIRFAASVGDYVKVYITDAPRASEFYERLSKNAASRSLEHEGDERTPWNFHPDVSGKYTLAVQDISKGASSHGGSYVGDPNGYRSETQNGTESTIEVVVGSRLTIPVGAGDDTGTLVFWGWSDTVRETNADTHGEVSPAIIDAASERLEFAARASATVAVLDDMVGKTSAELLQSRDLQDWLDELITDFNAHAADTASYHYVADTDNTVSDSYKSADNPSTFAQAVATVAAAVDRHITNDDGTEIGGASYHQDGSGNQKVIHADRSPVTGAGGPAEAFLLLCAALLSYNTHCSRGAGSGHKAADSVNTITTITSGTLLSVHQAILAELAKTAPTAPATANEIATTLAATVGATET